NDPLNLLAVDAGPNRSKGEGDTATWLPPRKGYRCTYVAGQVAVKKKYGLWVTAGERDAMKRVLSTCPDQALPTGGNPTSAPDRFHAR
ncbi:HNH endonuclease family protein, partial [Streptomyces sp. NPDC056728]